MQVPYRKPGKYSQIKTDPNITKGKFDELTNKLEALKKSQKKAADEVARLAEMGDFSENAAYQMAKGRLRGINNNILKIEHQLKNAEIITPQKNTGTVQLGSTVTIENDGAQKTYKILGSSETDPQKGVISHNSPLGAALIGGKVGDRVKIQLAGKEVEYAILKVECIH